MATEALVGAVRNGSAVGPAPFAHADVDFFHENGFLRIPSVFTPEGSQAHADGLDLAQGELMFPIQHQRLHTPSSARVQG